MADSCAGSAARCTVNQSKRSHNCPFRSTNALFRPAWKPFGSSLRRHRVVRGARELSRIAILSASSAITDPFLGTEKLLDGGVKEGTWIWRGHRIRYQKCGESGPPVLLIHGFGGNCDHWRKNLPILGLKCRAFAIDLLGYGFSDKPNPREGKVNELYCFETWAQQALDFLEAFVGEPAFIVCNSVGGIAGLQAAVDAPSKVRGVQLLNISLRMLHTTKQQPWQRPLVTGFQRLLRDTTLGQWFFGAVAKPQNIKSILQECYGNPQTVTDELVELILKPGLEPGAAEVFLDFASHSGGPLPEDLLPQVRCPVSIFGERPILGSQLKRAEPTGSMTVWRSSSRFQVSDIVQWMRLQMWSIQRH